MKKTVLLLLFIMLIAGTAGTAWAGQPDDSNFFNTNQVSQLKIGQQNQPGHSLVITEAQAGAIDSFVDGGRQAVITIELPTGLTWAKLPDIQINEGDLELGTPYYEGSTLTIPVKNSSSQASVIEISSIAYNADRTVPEGTILVTLGGSALVQTDFSNRNYITREVAAQCVTPAPAVNRIIKLNIGSAIYRVDNQGKAGQLRMAPYMLNGRTYMSVRDLGDSLGLQVIWDGDQQMVTLAQRDSKVVFAVGSNSYTVNGEVRTMGEAAVIKQGHLVMPVRLIAELFGANVGWDSVEQSLVIEAQLPHH